MYSHTNTWRIIETAAASDRQRHHLLSAILFKVLIEMHRSIPIGTHVPFFGYQSRGKIIVYLRHAFI